MTKSTTKSTNVSLWYSPNPYAHLSVAAPLKLPGTDIRWEGALCLGMHSSNPERDPYFVDDGKNGEKENKEKGAQRGPNYKAKLTRDSKSTCNSGGPEDTACPLLEACFNYAYTNWIDWGVWGGTTAKERRALRKRAGQIRAAESRTAAQVESTKTRGKGGRFKSKDEAAA